MIGIFDSGLGGLTIFKEIKKVLPDYAYIYLGDNLHMPYGRRSQEAVFSLTRQACDFLFKQGCNLIIIACNTATALALQQLQQEYLPVLISAGPKKNILGVVRPLAEAVAKISKGSVGVIGTVGTIHSQVYVKELKSLRPELKIYGQTCPLLVPLIEEGWSKKKETRSILRYYLRPLKRNNLDTLILGCTHYPLLRPLIQRMMGKKCAMLNPGEIVAQSLKDYLQRHPEIESGLQRGASRRYLVTDYNENFANLARGFLGENIEIEKCQMA